MTVIEGITRRLRRRYRELPPWDDEAAARERLYPSARPTRAVSRPDIAPGEHGSSGRVGRADPAVPETLERGIRDWAALGRERRGR